MTQKPFKQFVVLCLIMALALVGCEKRPLFSGQLMEEYEVLEDVGYKFAVQYPKEWLLLYDETEVDEMIERLEGYEGTPVDSIVESIKNFNSLYFEGLYYWYDLEHSTDYFVAGGNLTVTKQSGIKQTDISADKNLRQLQEMAETDYPEAYGGYRLLDGPSVEKFGGNTFATLTYTMVSNYTAVTVFQAYTAKKNYLFNFLFMVPTNDFDAQLEIFGQVLASLEL